MEIVLNGCTINGKGVIYIQYIESVGCPRLACSGTSGKVVLHAMNVNKESIHDWAGITSDYENLTIGKIR